jgi:hypothetical protein
VGVLVAINWLFPTHKIVAKSALQPYGFKKLIRMNQSESRVTFSENKPKRVTRLDLGRKIVLTASILLFLTSLTQPAYYIDRSDYDAWSNSLLLVLFGWLGTIMSGFSASSLAWLANPLLFISWIVFKNKPKRSIYLSFTATALAISFRFSKMVVSSESPSFSEITSYQAGYWLWVLSMAVFFIGSLLTYFRDGLRKKEADAVGNGDAS